MANWVDIRDLHYGQTNKSQCIYFLDYLLKDAP